MLRLRAWHQAGGAGRAGGAVPTAGARLPRLAQLPADGARLASTRHGPRAPQAPAHAPQLQRVLLPGR
eukprot:612744-Prorocentrum_minimum.AAC.1